MIKNILIKDFILIDELQLNLQKGFTVFTGETGAGKSIIIYAIDLLLGAKNNKEVVKTGTQKAYLEMTVELNPNFDTNILEENGIEPFDNELVISKEITKTSSRSRVNGVMVSLDFIKILRENLIDIHSQHQTYSYLQPKFHINLLDSFLIEDETKKITEYQNLYGNYVELKQKYENVKEKSEKDESQLDFLRFQVKELEEAELKDETEDEKLDEELKFLSNAETIKELSYNSFWNLAGDDSNIISALNSVKSNLSKLSEFDKDFEPYESEFIGALETIKDLSSELRRYTERIELDEERLEKVNERISLLDKLKRKYGLTLADVIKKYEELAQELSETEFSKDELLKLEKQLKESFETLNEKADEITLIRQNTAEKLSELLTKEIEKLELPKVRFKIDVSPKTISQSGKDKVEFFISTNVSEDLKPLAKVASGGEVSRVMLAIKNVFAQSDKINTIIFDEIDTGISGKASQAVCEAITKLSKNTQVICITHQPIIAAKADSYFFVAKSQDNDTTSVSVNLLNENDKIKALAQMAAGEVNENAINFAKQLVTG